MLIKIRCCVTFSTLRLNLEFNYKIIIQHTAHNTHTYFCIYLYMCKHVCKCSLINYEIK